MNENDDHKYDDIINLPHPTSRNHPRMPIADRAAQFAPFAALTGHEAAIKETARLTDEKIILSDEVIDGLNEKLGIIAKNIGSGQTVAVTYFVPDDKKAGWVYVTHTGIVKKLDLYKHSLVMTDGEIIPIGQISGIESELFK